MKNTVRYFVISGGVFAVFFLFGWRSAHASRLYFVPVDQTVGVDEVFTTDLRLDTQGDEINALDVRLEMNLESTEFLSAMDAGSLINLWIERPGLKTNACDVGKPCVTVGLSGVAPGGFVGDGLVARFMLKSHRAGPVIIAIHSESKVALNDANGHLSYTVFNSPNIHVDPALSPAKKEQEKNQPTKPTEFALFVDRDPVAYENQWVLSFATRDPDAGIAYYEIRERFLGFIGGTWERTDSPYVFRYQNLLSLIQVRAVDADGNIQERMFVPNPLRYLLTGLVSVVVFGLVFSGAWRIVHRLPHLYS